MNAIYLPEGEVWKGNLDEGYLFRPSLDWLYPLPEKPVTTTYLRGQTCVVGEGFLFYEGTDENRAKVSATTEMKRHQVTGYGPELMRQVFQAPRNGKMLAGFTVNHPGHWSSFPPHGFEREGEDAVLDVDEFFAFVIGRLPDAEFVNEVGGIMFCDPLIGRNYTVPLKYLRHNDVVRVLPGTHAVAALPGCRIGYCWAVSLPEGVNKLIDNGTGRYVEDADIQAS